MKQSGIYDAEKVVLSPISTLPKQPAKFTVDEVAKLTGDAKHGEQAVKACFACHQLGKEGVVYAPDLTGWAQRQTKEVLIRSILEPSSDIAHGYEGKRITVKDDMILDGLQLSEGDPILLQSMGGLIQRIPADRVKSVNGLDRSLMMSADELSLQPQDVADIAEYLRSLK